MAIAKDTRECTSGRAGVLERSKHTQHAQHTLSSTLTSAALVSRATSNTQSVIDALVSGTRTARPLSLPCQCDCV